MARNEPDAAFQILSQKLIKEHWDFYPTAGSRIGQHNTMVDYQTFHQRTTSAEWVSYSAD